MREIKFRLIKNKKIVGFCNFNNWRPKFTKDFETTYKVIIHDEKNMFTGLLDKQGKEIYEGDIVKGGVYYDFWNEDIGIVKFGEFEADSSGGEYGSVNCHGWFIEPIKGEIMKNKQYYDRKFLYKHLEVIGNVYENPELLKGD